MWTYIEDLGKHQDKNVQIKGWIQNKRDSKNLFFLVLRDGSGFCQCVVNKDEVNAEAFTAAEQLTLESSVIIEGKVVADEKQMGGYEIQATDVKVLQIAENYPISKKAHGTEFLLSNRHLWLRSRKQWATMRIRNEVIFSLHSFFREEGFLQMDAPLFTGNSCEGTTTLFSTEYYGETAFLSQSGQLYGEAMAMAMGRIYTFGPTFRAEKSKTRRHLSEFWMIEPEMAFADNDMNMDLIEKMIRYVIGKVLKNKALELEILERDLTYLQSASQQAFARLTYDEAVEILKGKREVEGQNSLTTLQNDLDSILAKIEELGAKIEDNEKQLSAGNLKKGKLNYLTNQTDELKVLRKDLIEQSKNIPQWIQSAENFVYGNDFGGSDETVISRLFQTPVMVYNWPHEIKAFYMKRTDDGKFAKGVDVLAPEGYGEIVGGGERETNLEMLENKIAEDQLPMEDFKWYLDLRRYGNVKHAGFGLGLERFVSWICKSQHLRECIPFPRMYGYLKP